MISDSEDENSSQGTSTSSALGVVDTSSSGEPSPHILEARLDMLEKAFPKIVSIFFCLLFRIRLCFVLRFKILSVKRVTCECLGC